jgi:hypothetical protein
MSNASGTTSPIPPSTHADSEGLAPAPQNKPLLPSVFSWLASLVRRYPFLSATLLYAFLVGGIAGVAKWSYKLDEPHPDSKLQLDKSGVGFPLMSL